MSDIVYILGAGASSVAGAPLTKDFLDAARSLRYARPEGIPTDSFDRVFSAIGNLQRVHSKATTDIHDLEAVFTIFEMARTLGGFAGRDWEGVGQLLNDLRILIATTIEQRIRFPRDDGGYTEPPLCYARFAELLDEPTVDGRRFSSAVITFNYDIALDWALFRHGQEIDYALEEGDALVGETPLLKLHGSLNWKQCRGCGMVVPLRMKELANRMHPARMRRAQEGWKCITLSDAAIRCPRCDVDVKDRLILVPPSWNKGEYAQWITPVWERAARELSEASSIVVIGFSLRDTDSFFPHLYALGTMGDIPLERFWVFDPDSSGAVNDRFSALIGPGAAARYRYFEMGFEDALVQLAGVFKAPPA